MIKTNEQNAGVTDEAKDRFSSDLQTLKSSFAQLREDMTQLLGNTLGTGKSAAVDLKDRMGDLKDGAVESVEKFGQKIGQRPLLSAAIALGIGFILAKLLMTRR